MGTDVAVTRPANAIDPMPKRALMAELYETASRWTPARLKDLMRKGATLVGCGIGRLPGFEVLGTHLAMLFARLKINCVLDVGAHVGQYGRFLRNIGYSGHIVSFEDDQDLADIDRLSIRYGGRPFHDRDARRVSAWMEPERWSSWPLPR